MTGIKAGFITKVQRTANVFSFRFEPPQKIDFLPGQFTQVIFDENDPNNRLLNKPLSYSCAPGKNYFEVTKKISESDFSKRLSTLKEGDPVLFTPALGRCVFTPRIKAAGFIVGGIGITPVISILEYIVEQGLGTDVDLLYANWTMQDIAFHAELDRFAAANRNIRILYVLADCESEDCGYSRGFITKELIAERLADNVDRTNFVFGPPAMVKAMTDFCLSLGCKRDKLQIESFAGY